MHPRKYGYHGELVKMVYKIFDKKTGLKASIKEELAQELHKLIIKKFKRKKVYARFKDKDLKVTFRQQISNGGVKYLLCVIDVFTKYSWVKHLNDKKSAKTVLDGFIEIVNESKRRPSKRWHDQGTKITIAVCKND